MEKTIYRSIFSPGKECNALQYICELLCQKKAKFDKVQLPIKFWNSMPKWNRYFKKNLRKVSILLKKYDERAIIHAINHPKFTNRYSIFTDFAEELISEEQEKINFKKAVKKTSVNRSDINEKPRKQKTKQGIKSKID